MSVRIDLARRFGRPQVKGVETWIVRERFIGGETVAEISHDYDLTTAQIEDAIRYELTKRWKRPRGMCR